jgi:hypothetical protein
MKAVVLVALLAISCGQGNPVASTRSPSPTPAASGSPSPATVASATPRPISRACSAASSYGLRMTSGTLEIVNTCGVVTARATVRPSSVQFCSPGFGAVLQPPVSASADKVFYRDGDVDIRYLTPTGQTGFVTTIPGGPTTVSFFSVSPDDRRIAIVVEDLSATTTMKLHLWVEDLQGGHLARIFSTTSSIGKGATTLWPMGWHSGRLVLALMRACTFEAVPPPVEWHVADASTAVRLATIGGIRTNCATSFWPSQAGVACVDYTKPQARIYDWNGRLTATVPTHNFGLQSALSPSGRLLSLANGGGLGDPSPVTRIASVTGGTAVTVPGHMACLWIDDSHWLAQDAVVAFPSGAVAKLPASGVCAGRFPGGL